MICKTCINELEELRLLAIHNPLPVGQEVKVKIKFCTPCWDEIQEITKSMKYVEI